MTNDKLDLTITRTLDAPLDAVWRAWSNPDYLKEWWCPRPWKTQVRAFDFRPGGAFHTFMSGPDGGESDNPGVFLEIVPKQRIVFTTVLTEGWRPHDSWMPMTAIFEMSAVGQKTDYRATAMHLNPETSQKHEEMGFFEGWGTCIEQLDAFAASISK